MGRGRITMRSGLSDLLLNPRPFNSRSKPWNWLSWWNHHSFQQLFDGVDGLIGLLHHSFELSLSIHHLGEIDFYLFDHLFFSKPEFGSDSLKAFVPDFGNGFSSACWLLFLVDEVTGWWCDRLPSSAKLLTYDFYRQWQWDKIQIKRRKVFGKKVV